VCDQFALWKSSAEYPTLFRIDRDVVVDAARLFPPSGRRADCIPMWVKAFGVRLEPQMVGRQKAWVRRSEGSFLGLIDLPVTSANGFSHLVMSLWVPSDAFSPVESSAGDPRPSAAPPATGRPNR
jgi:hypothetical protein